MTKKLPPPEKKVWATLLNFRTQRNLSQTKWGVTCGVSRSYVADWESARRPISPEAWAKMSKHLKDWEVNAYFSMLKLERQEKFEKEFNR